MKTHSTLLLSRIIRAGLRVHSCRYRVIAVGFNHKGDPISLKTNGPRLRTRGWHAEERVLYSSPKSLKEILIARVSARGELLPIHACDKCQELCNKRGVKIRRLE